MRRLFFVLLALPLIAACQAQTSPAPAPSSAATAGAREATGPEREAVLASIQGFLDGMRMKDTTAMNAHMDSLTRFTLLRPTRDGVTRVWALSAAQFLRAAVQPNQPGLDEPIRNPVVHVSGDLASVWAEYQVRNGDTVTHCGFDAFHLAKRDGRWIIINISDTFQQTGCGPMWPR